MNPALVALVLIAGLAALPPVWRLRDAGWTRGALAAAWLLYAVGIAAAVRFPGAFRLLLPILVVAYIAPFVVGTERLRRISRRRPPPPRPIKDVTPPPPPGLPGGDDSPDGAA
jgi:hypothetical protein